MAFYLMKMKTPIRIAYSLRHFWSLGMEINTSDKLYIYPYKDVTIVPWREKVEKRQIELDFPIHKYKFILE